MLSFVSFSIVQGAGWTIGLGGPRIFFTADSTLPVRARSRFKKDARNAACMRHPTTTRAFMVQKERARRGVCVSS